MASSTRKIPIRKDNSFGDFIRAAREKSGLSLSEAGGLINCSKAHLWDMERGQSRNPSIIILANLACAYGLDLGVVAEVAAEAAPQADYRLALTELKDAKARLSLVKAS